MKFSDYPFPCKYDAPFSHQVATVEFLLRNKRSFVLSTMGTGKTLSAAWAADFLMINSKIDKVLIIGPLSTLHAVWANELFESLPHRKAVAISGSRVNRLRALSLERDFYIINHDGIKSLEAELIDAKFDAIIIDELTAYKTAGTARTKSMMRIANQAEIVWGMTGSPVANSPVEAFAQAKVVRPKNVALPKYFGTFRDSVMKEHQYLAYKYVPRPGWEEKVKAVLSPSIRYELADCIDLPPTLYESREISMSTEQAKMYKSMLKDFKSMAKDEAITAVNAGVKAMKLMQIASGSVYTDEGSAVRLDCKGKFKEVVNLYNEGGNKPIIVYLTFRESIAALSDYLSKYEVATINGSVPAKLRGSIVNRFQKGEIDFLLLQPKAAAHGLTLTRASTVVWFTPYPSNEITQQANARVVRPGQTSTQLIVRLYSSEIEKSLYAALDDKESMSKTLLKLITAEIA